MSASLQGPPPDDGRRRSQRVALVLLGTMGVIGAGLAWDAWKRATAGDGTPTPTSQPATKPISADQTYTNNEFIPGVGYYHAPYHGWFPFPYNHHDPARGYFAGGLWQAAPFLLGSMMSSRPSGEAAASAFAAQRQRGDEERRQAQTRTSGFAGTRAGSSGFSAARPATTPPSSTSKPSVIRGGFGSSSHSSGGAS
ncbi:MAG: hypothetical protein EXS32_12320 [Opitutus sp.]|nr:hypothetical protein [Opitutus sp.]